MGYDRSLIKRILCGDRRSFEEFVERYKRLVNHIIFRIITNEEDRKDICQEVFLKIYRSLGSFQFRSKVSTWVASIAYNTALNHFRENTSLSLEEISEDVLLNNSFENNDAPDEYTEKRDISAYLQAEIAKLPVQYRAAITLYHLEEMSYHEISLAMNLPEGTVKSHLFRARRLLKERISSQFGQEEICRKGI
ncbi:MAG: sigma-70 family RNA polymerase sigma factor [candidate division Zixibacteria bacterium]|nr:sigma-70 family RNA polymerase sigma factor [candidate division Zixibacteria bacterium]